MKTSSWSRSVSSCSGIRSPGGISTRFMPNAESPSERRASSQLPVRSRSSRRSDRHAIEVHGRSLNRLRTDDPARHAALPPRPIMSAHVSGSSADRSDRDLVRAMEDAFPPLVVVLRRRARGVARGQRASVTTLYSSMNGNRTVTGMDSRPPGFGPSALGHLKAAMAFRPTASGTADLIGLQAALHDPLPDEHHLLRHRGDLIQEDMGGRRAAAASASSPAFSPSTDALSIQQSVVITGNPTGGSFHFLYPTTVPREDVSHPVAVTNASAQVAQDSADAMPRIQAAGGVSVPAARCEPAGRASSSTPRRAPHLLDAIENPYEPFTGGTGPRIGSRAARPPFRAALVTPAPQLEAGRKYWRSWSPTTRSARTTGPTTPRMCSRATIVVRGGRRSTADLALKIDSGSMECCPIAEPRPSRDRWAACTRAPASGSSRPRSSSRTSASCR